MFLAVALASAKKPLPTVNLDPEDQLRIGVKVRIATFSSFSFLT